MIQAVTTPQQQAEYRRRIAGKPYFESVLGTHLALFGAHPASGWMFYLLPGTAVLELRGGSGALCGGLPGDVVSLSPASASFDLYPNFEVRGREFKNIVNALK